MSELTPIQQAIEKLKELKETQEEIDKKHFAKYNVNSDYVLGKIKAYKQAIKALQNHLPKEQAAIEQTWNDCNEWKWRAAPTPTATEYFTNKYKSNE